MNKREEKDYALHVTALNKISEAITSDLYIEDILRLIVTITAQVMDSKICSLMLIDKDKNELVVKATQSISDKYNSKPNLKIGKGIAGTVAATGKPMHVQDVRTDERYINRDIAKEEGLCSLLSMPLQVKGEVIGVLNCYTDTPHTFTETEITTITTVANQAAIIIENSRLLVESQVIREELETKKAVERAKSILMKQTGCSEESAFRKIQKYSMDTRKSMREVAESIITAQMMREDF
jgi:signal transduction protein with GAF and PtsI domain